MSKIIVGIFIYLTVSYLIVIIHETITEKHVRDLKISKKKFVTMVLHWCSINIGSINDPYYLKIHYYKHRKFQGAYYPTDKLIEIYIYDELELGDLISTLVHEYFHHLQSVRENAIEDYNKKFEEFGQKNTFEVEAIKASQQYTQSCLDWILAEIKLK